MFRRPLIADLPEALGNQWIQRFLRALSLPAFCGLAPNSPLSAQEVQAHGLGFERWVCDSFFDGYRPASYTQKWDIPAAANTRFGGVPVNPKAIKYGTPVDLGDALRQFDIAEPFILVLGFWQQEGDVKRFVNIVAPRIEPVAWKKLWGPITRVDLERLDAVIKDRTLTPVQARAAALKIKQAPPFTEATIVVNPKIDLKTQRRLQCSLRFSDVFTHLAPGADPRPHAPASLWGMEFSAIIASKPRNSRRRRLGRFASKASGSPRAGRRHRRDQSECWHPAPSPNARRTA